MTITTSLDEVTREGARIGVHIKRERPESLISGVEAVDNIIGDLHDSMEIVSILKALKDCNERAFNTAMDMFIEEELSDGKSVC